MAGPGERQRVVHEALLQINATGRLRTVVVDGGEDSPLITIETTCVECGEVLSAPTFNVDTPGELQRAVLQSQQDAGLAVAHVAQHDRARR